MKVTLNWLKTHINFSYSDKELCSLIREKLDIIGLEVEEMVNFNDKYNCFKIAEITSIIPHPEADKLNLCEVNCGDGNTLSIVCGASNVKVGAKVVLAAIGSTIPNGGLVIQKTKIRGRESSGMLCSAEELCLDSHPYFNKDGIIILSETAPIGESFAKYAGLDDIYFDIKLTPNRRKDCSSVKGIARDLYASGAGEIIEYKIKEDFSEKKLQTFNIIKEDCEILNINFIRIDLCNDMKTDSSISCDYNHYTDHVNHALYITGNIHENPLVNISNYTMFDTGHPNHIYDANKIVGQPVIRRSIGGEIFIAIGGTQYVLPAGLIVIADDVKILSVAGVIGGELSKVDSQTKCIMLEVAVFKQYDISKSSKALSINTDAKIRFVAGVDKNPESIEYAIYTLISNIKRQYPNLDILSWNYAINKKSLAQESIKQITFNKQDIDAILGINISIDKICHILQKLGFVIIKTNENGIKDCIKLNVPTWRQDDIEGIPDIAEEIMRIYGIEKIPPAPFHGYGGHNSFEDKNKKTRKVIDTLHSIGYHEVINYTMYGFDEISSFFEDEVELNTLDNKQEFSHIEIANPLNIHLHYMRRSILPELIKNISKNYTRGFKTISLCEIGNIYSWQKNKSSSINATIHESQNIGIVRSGWHDSSIRHNIQSQRREYDFYDMRDDIMTILGILGIDDQETSYLNGDYRSYAMIRSCPKYYHPYRSSAIYYELCLNEISEVCLEKIATYLDCIIGLEKSHDKFQILVAYLGEIHPVINQKYSVSQKIIGGEIFVENIELLLKILQNITDDNLKNDKICHFDTKYRKISLNNYQITERDLAFIMPADSEVGSIIKAIANIKNDKSDKRLKNLIDIQIFDSHIMNDIKSVGIRFKMQAEDKTMDTNEINQITKSIIDIIEKNTNAVFRYTEHSI